MPAVETLAGFRVAGSRVVVAVAQRAFKALRFGIKHAVVTRGALLTAAALVTSWTRAVLDSPRDLVGTTHVERGGGVWLEYAYITDAESKLVRTILGADEDSLQLFDIHHVIVAQRAIQPSARLVIATPPNSVSIINEMVRRFDHFVERLNRIAFPEIERHSIPAICTQSAIDVEIDWRNVGVRESQVSEPVSASRLSLVDVMLIVDLFVVHFTQNFEFRGDGDRFGAFDGVRQADEELVLDYGAVTVE